MESNIEKSDTEQLLEQVLQQIEQGRHEELRDCSLNSHPGEWADLLESLPLDQRRVAWEVVPDEQEGEVLASLHEEARASIIGEMAPEELVAAAENMDDEDLADVIEELSPEVSESVLDALKQDQRARLQIILSYGEDTAGRIMSTEALSVRADVSLAVVLRWLRRHAELPRHTDALMVTDDHGVFVGKLPLASVLTGEPNDLVETVMETGTETVLVSMTAHDVAALFERRDLISVAVLNDDGFLLGRITVDDVLHVIRDEADGALLRSAGLDEEEDLFAPIVPSARRRGV